MNNFDGHTWVAFSDLSGLKALYEKKPEDAAVALDKFYNTVYALQQTDNPINSIVVSDCAIFWIDKQNCVDDLKLMLEQLKGLHEMMLPDYLLRSTIAYGHFEYEGRLENPKIRKNKIVGAAYLDAYAKNDKIDHGAVVVVKLPKGLNYKSLRISNSYKQSIKANCPTKGFHEYFWTVDNSHQIKDFIKRREEANNATFSKLKELYSES